MNKQPTLHEALAAFGITSKPGSMDGVRKLFMFGYEFGEFDAHEGWNLVRDLSGSPVDCPITTEA